MLRLQVFADPRHKMVLEGPLDDLMQEVGGQELVNVGARKVPGERLQRA
jgi:hypothetical protein